MRAFDQKPSTKESAPGGNSRALTRMRSNTAASPQSSSRALTRIKSELPTMLSNMNFGSTKSPALLGASPGIVNEEWSETSYVGMNILINVLTSMDNEICAQASAKINTILHSRTLQNVEEACYLIASVEKAMNERIGTGICGGFCSH